MPLRVARKAGDTVRYRNAAGESQNVVVSGVAGAAPATPASSTAASGGTLADSTTFGYKLTAIVNGAETAASAQKTQATGVAGNDSTVTIDWSATPVTGATAYRIYGRTNTGPWGFLAEVATPGTAYIDTGAATPGAAVHTTTDHVGFVGPHDNTARTTVPKATTEKSTNAYFSRY